MHIIGLTGGIAAGKTSASTYLASLGAHILCADEMSREASATPEVLDEIARAFGPGMILPNGALNRKALGERVFADDAARFELERLMHPYIRQNIQARLARLEMTYPKGVAVVDAALLIEAGMTDLVDEVWLVAAPEQERLRRLMKRDSIDFANAQLRLAAQMPQAEKMKYAHEIIHNAGGWEHTRAQLDALWARITQSPCPYGAQDHQRARERADELGGERIRLETPQTPATAPVKAQKRRMAKPLVLVGVLMIVLAVVAAIWINNQMELKTYKLDYPELILLNAEAFGVDPILVAAIIHVESGNRPAIASPKGAIGLMQIMPGTGEWIAEKLSMADYSQEMLSVPEVNIRFGCWYLRFLQDRFENTDEVLASYNAGQGTVNKWLQNPELSDDGVTLKHIPYKETEQYVERIHRAYGKYQNLYSAAWEKAAPYDKAYAQ